MYNKINEEIKILKEENFNLKKNFKNVEVFIKALINENKELERKIKKLLVNGKSDQDYIDVLEREKEQIVMENEKLRKYVKLYITAIMNGCDLCPYEDDIDICDTETEPMCEGCILREEMCKFGIEVDNE